MDASVYILHANLETGLGNRSAAKGPGLLDPLASHLHCPDSHGPTRLGGLCARYRSVLDSAERVQAGKFRFARDSLLYTVAHALLRIALSRCCPLVEPSDWRFRRGRYGKPSLVLPKPCPGDLPGLRFSLSHSWPHIAILVTRCGHCGIDIEPARTPAGFEDMAQAVFQPEECVEMLSSSSPQTHFLRLWTLREALCKALGCGLPRGFSLLRILNGFTSISLRRHPLSVQSLALCNSAFVLSACILTRHRQPNTTIEDFDFSQEPDFSDSYFPRIFPEDETQCPAMQQQVHHCSGA